jgi:hypothetical protein
MLSGKKSATVELFPKESDGRRKRSRMEAGDDETEGENEFSPPKFKVKRITGDSAGM